jgi:solute carrier family 6 amino acid/orphan transporter-like 15/16/17/18/20
MLILQGKTVAEPYPDWVMVVAGLMITAGVLPMPIVFILRRCQCLKLDLDIHQGAIRRIDTTVSTKEMMGDVDVSYCSVSYLHFNDTIVMCMCGLMWARTSCIH